ncbi:MAG: elongation factor G [Thermoanaerobaculia bacterium]
MKRFLPDKIRNVCFAGHSDTGKTTLTSALLYAAGTVNRFLRVEDGNTITDFDEEEIQRRISIYLSLAWLEYKDKKINILDTPGFSMFISETIPGIKCSDTVGILVNGVQGIEIQTDKVFKISSNFNVPVFFIINKLDKENSDPFKVLEQLKHKYGNKVIPLSLPIGKEADFKGVVNLMDLKSYITENQNPKAKIENIPENLKEISEKTREELIEKVAEGDDQLMQTFFDKGSLTEEEFLKGLKKSFLNRDIFPVFFTSAASMVGLEPLLQFTTEIAPSPDMRKWEGKNPLSKEPLSFESKETAPASAYVFKTISDIFAGKITIFKAISGTIKSDETYFNSTRGVQERFGSINTIQGKQLSPISEIYAGDIAAVTKLKETKTFDTLCDKTNQILYDPINIGEPSISFAIEPKSKGDEDKISNALQKIMEEEPIVKSSRDPQTKELVISGAGQLHVEIIANKLKNKYGVSVNLKLPKVPYKETIVKSAQANYRHKKQTGGHGQFAECMIQIDPAPRGSGYEFIDKIFGGAISQNFRPSVDKGIQDAASKGILAGFPVVDFKVTLLDGKEHPVDSSDMAFKIAGSMAFKEAAKKAGVTILEPIYNVEIYTPEEFMGDIMGDLNGRRGRVLGMDMEGDLRIIKAQVPLAEMLTYSSDLRSKTQGRASFTMEFAFYEEVPKHLQEKIIAQHKKEKEEEEE